MHIRKTQHTTSKQYFDRGRLIWFVQENSDNRTVINDEHKEKI